MAKTYKDRTLYDRVARAIKRQAHTDALQAKRKRSRSDNKRTFMDACQSEWEGA